MTVAGQLDVTRAIELSQTAAANDAGRHVLLNDPTSIPVLTFVHLREQYQQVCFQILPSTGLFLRFFVIIAFRF